MGKRLHRLPTRNLASILGGGGQAKSLSRVYRNAVRRIRKGRKSPPNSHCITPLKSSGTSLKCWTARRMLAMASSKTKPMPTETTATLAMPVLMALMAIPMARLALRMVQPIKAVPPTGRAASVITVAPRRTGRQPPAVRQMIGMMVSTKSLMFRFKTYRTYFCKQVPGKPWTATHSIHWIQTAQVDRQQAA